MASALAAQSCMARLVWMTSSGASSGTISASCSAHSAARRSVTQATMISTCPSVSSRATHASRVAGRSSSRRPVLSIRLAVWLVQPSLSRHHAVIDA